MSEPNAAAAVVEAPDFGKMESIADFRANREKATVEAPVEAPAPEAAKPAEEAKPAEQPAAEAAQPETEAEKADKAAKKGSLQSRIDELVREKHQTAAEASATRAEIAALRAELATLKGGKPAEAGKPAEQAAEWDGTDPKDLEPDVNAFDDYQKYVKATAAWEARKILRVERATMAQQAQAQAAQAADGRAYQAGKTEYADFDDVIGAFVQAGGRFAPHVAQEIRENPIGHRIAYAAAKDPALLAQLNGAQTIRQFDRAVAKLEATLSEPAKPAAEAKPAEKPAPKVSNAPAPVPAIAAGEATATTADPSKISSVATWKEARKQFL